MMLSIAILSCVGFIFSIFSNLVEKHEFDANTFLTAIAVISCWNLCLPISIIILVIVGIMLIVAFSK